MNYSNELLAEVNRQLSLVLFPKGCGIAPISFEITGLGAKMDEIPRVKIEGLLEPEAMERLAQVLKAGQKALEPVNAVDMGGGRPMNTIPKTDFQELKHVQLYMGGEWVRGGINHEAGDMYSSEYTTEHTIQWDEENQPTAWKPL